MTDSVTSILAERFGLEARPGAKVECPFCGHNTCSVKRDDTLAKCFHPDCGRAVTRWSTNLGGGELATVLEQVFRDFHAELLKQRGTSSCNAYNYCVAERGIAEFVVADSMLGAVPQGYDVDAVFAPALEKARAAAFAESGQHAGKRKSYAAQKVELLSDACTKLSTCVAGGSGSLAFFFTDAMHRIVSIRFRQPYTKKIRYFKPGERAGVFNRELFINPDAAHKTNADASLVVVEGEFNQLQLQSLCARIGERKGRAPETQYVHACAVGGVHNADIDTLTKLSSELVVCYDNDSDDAGRKLVEHVASAMGGTAFTTPIPDSDLDSFIRSYGQEYQAAYDAVRQLLAARKQFSRPFSAVRDEVDRIRRSQGGKGGLKDFEVSRAVSDLIIADLKCRGKLYNDSRLSYLFLSEDKELITIGLGELSLQQLLSKYGLGPSERIATYVVDALRIAAFQDGERTEVYPFAHYDISRNVLYLSNFSNQVFKISTSGIECCDNGVDGVLFSHHPSWTPFTIGELEQDTSPLHAIIINPIPFDESGVLSVSDCRYLFLMWFLSLFFPELFPTRPILAMIGEKGSAKTTALRRIGSLLFGPRFEVTSISDDAKDFEAAITNNQYVVFDNADKKMDWLEDKLAVIATGGSIKRRELYTTNRQVEFPIRAFPAITSRTPHFRREDVAERLLPLHVVRLNSFVADSKLRHDLESMRDRIMTEVLNLLLDAVRALGMSGQESFATNFRMADFANFMLKIAPDSERRQQTSAILDRLSQQQERFAIEDEPIIELLNDWLHVDKYRNVGREITAAELCKELSDLAGERDIELWCKRNPKAFAQRLRNLKGTLEKIYDMRTRTAHAGTKLYSFAIGLVPGKGERTTLQVPARG